MRVSTAESKESPQKTNSEVKRTMIFKRVVGGDEAQTMFPKRDERQNTFRGAKYSAVAVGL